MVGLSLGQSQNPMWSVGDGAAAEDFGGKEGKWLSVNVTAAFGKKKECFNDGQRRFGLKSR